MIQLQENTQTDGGMNKRMEAQTHPTWQSPNARGPILEYNK